MPALTIRNLPDEVHASMRARAAAAGMSMESLIRQLLADAASEKTARAPMGTKGFAEACAPFLHAPARQPEALAGGLWGALKGSVSVPCTTDLTAGTNETWSAEH